MTDATTACLGALRGSLLVLAVIVGVATTTAGAYAQSAPSSTAERERAAKEQEKRDKEFNREVLYRHVVGPKVLALGPYTISMFVQGQPLEARLRVAVQATTELARSQLESQRMAVNGIIYPLAVRMFEQGRPSAEHIRTFKEDARSRLLERYPGLVDDVFIESMV